VEGGWGESRQVILVGPQLLYFPRVWEGVGVQLGGAEHFLEIGVVEGAVDGGSTFSWGGGGAARANEGGMKGGTGLRGRASWLGWGGGQTSCREALWGGRRGRGVEGGCCGASGGGRGGHTM